MTVPGQNTSSGKLHSYFTLYCQAEGKLAPPYTPFREFVDKLESRRGTFNGDKAFVHHVFVKAQQQFFREFQEYAPFSDLVTTGKYNCLSGTALFALLLDHFRIDHHVIETNHHTFILAQVQGEYLLLETTDAQNGFVSDPKSITRKMAGYENIPLEQTGNSKVFRFQYPKVHMDTVSLTSLLGLFHYNHSVEALNARDLGKAIAHLHHALLLHRSEKMETYLDLVSTSVSLDDKLTLESRNNYLEKLRVLKARKPARPADVSTFPLVR